MALKLWRQLYFLNLAFSCLEMSTQILINVLRFKISRMNLWSSPQNLLYPQLFLSQLMATLFFQHSGQELWSNSWILSFSHSPHLSENSCLYFEIIFTTPCSELTASSLVCITSVASVVFISSSMSIVKVIRLQKSNAKILNDTQIQKLSKSLKY